MKVVKPKGLRLFDRDPDTDRADTLEVRDDINEGDGYDRIQTPAGCVAIQDTFLDADQLDKLAQRCKEWAKYLRAQKHVKPVPPKKWEDL